MVKRWAYKISPDEKDIKSLSDSININPYLCTLLLQRGIRSFDSAKAFFRPSLNALHDPFLMKDMDVAVLRIHQAIAKGEKILVYGDYDVDGTTSVSLVYLYLKEIHVPCEIYIPDRYTEGYGISLLGIEWAERHGYSLIIALDCGIKSMEMVELAHQKHIDFIICDHHLPGPTIPNAVAVLDPKRKDCPYPYKELSGCGIGFKLMQAYAKQYRDESQVYKYLDLVAVSIASDIVPITGENRILTYFGLNKLEDNPLPGLKALKDLSGIKNPLDVAGIVFYLGPRINAAGRIAHARTAVELLTAETVEAAVHLAESVNLNNEVRKQVDSDITEEALAMIENNIGLKHAKSTVLYKDSWHKGVIGIVASRCIEKYYRPTVILTESNNKITGSARSIHGFDLYNAILECSDLLEKFGGHKYAAGLTMDKKNLGAFQRKFEEVVASQVTDDMLSPVIEIDVPLPFDAISPKFVQILKQMAPFGPDNQNPIFEANHVYALNSLSTIKERHLKFKASQKDNLAVFNVIGFDFAEHYTRMARGDSFRMAYTVEENHYNGNTSTQLKIKDIKFE